MSETSPKENNQSNNSSNIGSIIVIVLVAAIIGGFLFLKGFFTKEIKKIASTAPSTTYDNPIPYVFPDNYKNGILNYVYNISHSQILLILGSSGSGKTRSLIELGNAFPTNSTFMLKIDFETIGNSISKNDLMYSIRKNIINSIEKLDGKKGFRIQSALPILQKYVNALELISSKGKGFQRTKLQHKKLQNNLLQNLTQYYLSISDAIVTSHELAFRTLLEATEAISPYMNPVIVLTCPENLFRCHNQRMSRVLSSFFTTAQKLFKDHHSLPIIVEVSDQSIFLESFNNTLCENDDSLLCTNCTHKKFPFDHDRFKLLYNDGFNFKEAEKVLSIQNKIFAKNELAILFEAIGGHGQSMAMAHEYAREGFTIGEIISNERSLARNLVVKSIKTSSNETAATKYLRKVLKRKEIPIASNVKLAHFFLKNRILTIANETKVKFSNKNIFTAAADTISVISKAN